MNSFADDDGIIDLNAIASRSAPPRAPVAALFSEPPPAIAVDNTDASPVQKSGNGLKTGLLIGGGALAVVATIGALVFVFRGETPTARIAAPPPPPVVAAAPAATTAAPAPAAPAPAEDSSDAADEKTGTKKKNKSGGGKHASSAGASFASKASAPASKPVKAADPCHCHGDFQCNIRCSAGR